MRGLIILSFFIFQYSFYSCQFKDQEFVDFMDLEAGQGMSFRVIGRHETDLSDGLPNNCYLPNGMRVNEYNEEEDPDGEDNENSGIRKTNSVTGAGFLQELLRYDNQNKVIEIVGTYPSINSNWDSIRLSGKVILPDRKSVV